MTISVKNANFSYPSSIFNAAANEITLGFYSTGWAQETRVMDLPGDRKSLTICIFQQTISILQTERQTLCVLAHADVR